ncbi:MAG: hypothetical protein VX589_04095 [Myxococcota bacterium]|nr:hypothetical protein [Myxococcota bacterium]
MTDELQPPEVPNDGPADNRESGLTRDDLRSFLTVTAVLVAMLFLALGLKHRRDVKRQGFAPEQTAIPSETTKKGQQREIGRFRLVLSHADRTDEDGLVITHVPDMIIRDREHYHQGGHRDEVDEGDTFFNTPQRRQFWRTRMNIHPEVTTATIHRPLLVQLFHDRVLVRLATTREPQ